MNKSKYTDDQLIKALKDGAVLHHKENSLWSSITKSWLNKAENLIYYVTHSSDSRHLLSSSFNPDEWIYSFKSHIVHIDYSKVNADMIDELLKE